jgi:hypothetical protein
MERNIAIYGMMIYLAEEIGFYIIVEEDLHRED